MIKLIKFKSINEIKTNEFFRRSFNLEYDIYKIGHLENAENISLIIKLSVEVVQALLSKTDIEGIMKIIYYFAKEKIINNIKSISSDNITKLNFNVNEYRKYEGKIHLIIESIEFPSEENIEIVEVEFSNKMGF